MNAPKPVVIMGGWGSGQIVASVIEDINRATPTWRIEGYLNDVEDLGSAIGGYNVIGRTQEASDCATRGVFVHYAMRNAKYARSRIERFKAMSPEEVENGIEELRRFI